MIKDYKNKFCKIITTLLWDKPSKVYELMQLTGFKMRDINPIIMRLENLNTLVIKKVNNYNRITIIDEQELEKLIKQ